MWGCLWPRGSSPCDSLQEHQLQPGPNKALLHCLHVLGGPDHPQNPATCDPLRSTSAVPSLCPGGTAGGLFLGAKTSDPTRTLDETPPSPVMFCCPGSLHFAHSRPQHSPIRPLFPFPLPPSLGFLGAAAVQQRPWVKQPGWNAALPLLSLAQLRPKTSAEKGLSLWYPLPRAGS